MPDIDAGRKRKALVDEDLEKDNSGLRKGHPSVDTM
jgi:hypothetical protein